MKYLVWIWHNMAGIRWNTLVRIGAGITQVVLGLWMIWLSKQFIDVTIRTGSSDDVLVMAATLIAVVVAGILLRQLYYYMSVTASTRQSNSIRLRVFSSLFRRQLYDDPLHSGDVTSRLSKDIDQVSNATTTMLPQFVVTAVQLAGAFLLLASMDVTLALALVLVTPVVVGAGKLLAHRLRSMTLDIRQQESVIQMQVQEGMENNLVIRSLGGEQWVTERLDHMQGTLMGRVMRRTRFTVVTRLIMAFTFSMGYLLAFIWGGLQLRQGTITFGVMTSFLQLVGQIQNPILNLLNMLPQFFYASASIDRIDDLEQSEKSSGTSSPSVTSTPSATSSPSMTSTPSATSTPSVTSTPSATSTPSGTSSPSSLGAPLGLRASGVTFAYASDDRLVLNRFSHDFRPGSKTAVMGHTGVGKTTLFRLMLDLVQPSEGCLTVYGPDGEQAVSAETRSCFVFVPQGNTLMSGTIRYNLQLARPDVTDDELREVLHDAMADFVFDLPDGLDTVLGERGIGLSEGQAQRVAIARGLLRPGSILLLDEISASLDADTERELFIRLFRGYADRTMIFITHRTEVCRLCDDVIHLEPKGT